MTKNSEIPILCIDEFEALTSRKDFDREFFSSLRAMTQSSGLGLVVASKVPLVDVMRDRFEASNFFNVFEQLTLKPFTQKETEQFVSVKSAQAQFTEEEQAYFLKYGQDNRRQWPPLRLQLAGKLLLESKLVAEKETAPSASPHNLDYKQIRNRMEKTYREMVQK
jgi:hypothetical protein